MAFGSDSPPRALLNLMRGIVDILRDAASPNSALRQTAEQDLEAAGKSDPQALFRALFEVAQNQQEPKPILQMAMLVIKSVVVRQWSPAFEQYTGPMLDFDLKHHIEERLVQLVAKASDPVVQSGAALVVARIASNEYPDQWPDLVDQTVQMLSNEATEGGALMLFKELLVDTLREEDFFKMGDFALSRLLEIAQKKPHRLLAIQCFHECINFFLMGDDDQMPTLEKAATKYIGLWCQLFVHLIANDGSDSDLQTEIIQTLRDVESAFPHLLAPELPAIFNGVFEQLEAFAAGGQGEQDHELATAQVNFLELILNSDGGKPILKHLGSAGNIVRFVALAVKLAKIPAELQDAWSDDFNEFVTYDQELAVDVWPRSAIGALIGEVHLPNLLSSVLSAGNTNNWIDTEAILFLTSCILQQVAIESQDVTNAQIASLVDVVKAATQPPLLAARAIITGGVMAKYLNKRVSQETKLGLISQAMQVTDSSPAVIKVACLKTMSVGCAIAKPQLRPYQAQLLQLVASLVPDSNEDTPAFLVDVLLNILNLDFTAAVHMPAVFELFFALVRKDTANIELNVELLTVVEDMLQHTADDPVATEIVYSHLLTPVLEILKVASANGFEYSSDLQFALDLASVVFERGEKLPHKQQLLDTFYELVSTASDPQILQAGSFAYAALLEHTGQGQLSEAQIQRVLEVAARLLNPSLQDSAALASGRLVTAIVDNFGDDIGPVVQELLVAAAQRLISATNAYLVESLTLVFVELIVRNAQAVVDLLAEHNLLEPVLTKWIGTFKVVRGSEEIYKNVVALEKVFDLHDPRVEAIQVKDEAIAPKDMIITRSKAKNMQYKMIPLPLKIIKLLVNELGDQPAPDNDEDDEWADELTLDVDGEPAVDRRVYGLIMNWFKSLGPESVKYYRLLNERERAILLIATR